jgi:hypothetical protein
MMNSLRKKVGELLRHLIKEPAFEGSGQGLLVMGSFQLNLTGRIQFPLNDWQSHKYSYAVP